MTYDGDFAYTLPHEQWYAEPHTTPTVEVTYRPAGMTTEFTFAIADVTADRRDRPQLRFVMDRDSWDAWRDLPELFEALARRYPSTLAQVTSVLAYFGAKDATVRERPGREGAALAAMKSFQWEPSPSNARAASAALLAFAEHPDGEPPF